jgi:hypothetical protein
MASALPQVTSTVHDEVASQIKSFAASAEPKSFAVLLLTVSSLVKVTTEGDTAKAAVTVEGRPVELTLRRAADRWKVVAFNDEALVQRVVDSMMKQLPPIGVVDSNNPLFKNPGKSRKKQR